jgi:hypothetical protein
MTNEFKQCTKCSTVKNIDEYYIRKVGKQKGKPRSTCKLCDKSYRENNKEVIKKWKANNPLYDRQRDLKRKFGINLEKYDNLLLVQNNNCAICGVNIGLVGKNLCVDHCHKTNKIRGLLCNSCNLGLGMFKDNQVILNKAAEYLNKHL